MLVKKMDITKVIEKHNIKSLKGIIERRKGIIF